MYVYKRSYRDEFETRFFKGRYIYIIESIIDLLKNDNYVQVTMWKG